MANAGRKTDGCQFFITLKPMPWMDGRHTVFGKVVEGLDVVEAIATRGSKLGSPREKVMIEKAWIEEENHGKPVFAPLRRGEHGKEEAQDMERIEQKDAKSAKES